MTGANFDIPGLGMPIGNTPYPPENFDPSLLAATTSANDGKTVEEAEHAPHQEGLIREPAEEGKEATGARAAAPVSSTAEGQPSVGNNGRQLEEKDDVAMTGGSPQQDSSAVAEEGDKMAIDKVIGEQAVLDRQDRHSGPGLTDALEAALDELMPRVANTQEAAPEIEGKDEAAGGDPEWEEDSDPYESSTESSSSDSSDEEDSDAGGLLGIEETARLLMAAEEDGEDGEKRDPGARAYVRSKNETSEKPLPKPDVVITPEMRIELLGYAASIVENILVIKSEASAEVKVLDTGSVLCKEDRTVIAALSDTIGSVRDPAYAVVFESEEEIKELGLTDGTPIYYSLQHAQYVFTRDLKATKGSDASNINDEEVGADEIEFSDDEQEAEYKRRLKAKKKGGRGARAGGDFFPHPLRQEVEQPDTLTYDDGGDADEDGPYKPLARPAGFAQGVAETLPAPPSQHFGLAGRGGHSHRGAHRGRGGRGDFRSGRHRGGYRGDRRDQDGHGRYSGSPSFNHDRTASSPTASGISHSPSAQNQSPTIAAPSPPSQWPGIPPPFQGLAPVFPQAQHQTSPNPIPSFNFNVQGWNAAQPSAPAQAGQGYGFGHGVQAAANGYPSVPHPSSWANPSLPQVPQVLNYGQGFFNPSPSPAQPPMPQQQPNQQAYPQQGQQATPYWNPPGGGIYRGQ